MTFTMVGLLSLKNVKGRFLRFIGLWPPFLGMGIRVLRLDPDFRRIEAGLKLRFWNANYVGTQFGGAMFAMADPFYMVMISRNLGPGYRVLDRSASISYEKPGRTDLRAIFEISETELAEIRANTESGAPYFWTKKVEILDTAGVVVAVVEKSVYIIKV